MFRGTTARTPFTAPTAAMFTLPFFALPAPFAAAHTVRQVEAKDRPGTNPSGTAPRAGGAATHSLSHAGDPTGPLRIRDRHRAITAYDRVSRPSTAHAPAALEFFRR
ncbi:hypothetical protein GCM10010254_34410 [Streptomyces chromofuscus]|nr:hypothetical protein GCM10010254_34410 [Streptomyces chromofuscus]